MPGLFGARTQARTSPTSRPRAERDGDEWVISGQKVWTSLAHWADWCFVLCRTDRDAPKHQGLSYLLVPMRQAGIEIRPIRQITGTSEFNEVFFDRARTPLDHVVGAVNDGWRVAMGTLAFERGASTLGQQADFANELDAIVELARTSGRIADAVVRQRIADAWIGLLIMRYNALRALAPLERGEITPLTSITKLAWATFHRGLGELALDVLGPDGEVADDAPVRADVDAAHVPLFTRRHDLRRLEPGAAQHHRRARPGPARKNPNDAARNRPRHGLLAGKTVVVTAAAGTGIGFATAKRAAEEGATVVVSDHHERRLGEAADRLADTSGTRPLAVVCDVTREEQVQALVDAAVAEHGTIDVMVNNAGLGGTANLVDMTDDEWHVVLDVTLTGTFRCTRAALRRDDGARPWRDREQRVGARLASAGRSGALRRGEGRCHGADAMRRARSSSLGRAGQRGRAEPGDASVPRQGDERRAARRARRARGVRARARSRGRSRTSSCSSRATTPPT